MRSITHIVFVLSLAAPLVLSSCASRAPRVETTSKEVSWDWRREGAASASADAEKRSAAATETDAPSSEPGTAARDSVASREAPTARSLPFGAANEERAAATAGARDAQAVEVDELDLEELEAEIDRRLAAERARMIDQGEFEHLNDIEVDERRLRDKLAALRFMIKERSPEALAYQAIRAIEAGDGAPVDGKLLAAAVLGRSGSLDERNALVEDVYRELFASELDAATEPSSPSNGLSDVELTDSATAPANAPEEDSETVPSIASESEIGATDSVASEDLLTIDALYAEIESDPSQDLREKIDSFRIEKLVFADPEDAARIEPGETCRVRGELVGFAETLDATGGDLFYRRTFTASLRLLDSKGETRDFGYFLDRAESRSNTPRASIEFWAECTLPSDLESGTYLLQVEAIDHESGQSARADLPLEVTRR
ncbi:MAG TPA: hypothetical protein VK116_17895 [Planctomycetota bacterium]|nr:hypothetical protein [Planctomycetota bacterium]